MKKNVKTYTEFLNEKEQPVVYPTNFSGMVQGAVNAIHSQVMAIARQMAEEKAARNPYRYDDADKIAEVQEVDVTRALNLIFHSDWKKMLKNHQVQEWAKSCIDRASKHDDRANKKNQRALRSMKGSKDSYKTDLGSQGFSRDSGSSGMGKNK
jgi:hypothetical protein